MTSFWSFVTTFQTFAWFTFWTSSWRNNWHALNRRKWRSFWFPFWLNYCIVRSFVKGIVLKNKRMLLVDLNSREVRVSILRNSSSVCMILSKTFNLWFRLLLRWLDFLRSFNFRHTIKWFYMYFSYFYIWTASSH